MSSDFSATALAIRSLQALGSPADAPELNAHIARASTWLRTHMPATTEDKVFRLFGLRWAKAEASLSLGRREVDAERAESRWRVVAAAWSQQRRVHHRPGLGGPARGWRRAY